jgi:hypothetical protein
MAVWPTGIKLGSAELSSNTPQYSSESANLRTFVVTIPSHRYEAEVETVRLAGADRLRFWAFVESLRGASGTFDLQLPPQSTHNNAASGSCTALATAAGAVQVPIAGAPASQAAWLKAGGLVRFAGHTKAYCLIDDVATNGSGAGTLRLNAALQRDVTLGEAVSFRNVPIRFRLRPGASPQRYSQSGQDGPITSFSLALIEAI